MSDLKKYLPKLYDGVYEIDQIVKAENAVFDQFQEQKQRVTDNQYILTADRRGIENFEKIFDIVAMPEVEDLEYRRQRLMARAAMALPFSLRFLKNKLDELLSEDSYQLNINNNKYELYIDTKELSSIQIHELKLLLVKVLPVNLLYIINIHFDPDVFSNDFNFKFVSFQCFSRVENLGHYIPMDGSREMDGTWLMGQWLTKRLPIHNFSTFFHFAANGKFVHSELTSQIMFTNRQRGNLYNFIANAAVGYHYANKLNGYKIEICVTNKNKLTGKLVKDGRWNLNGAVKLDGTRKLNAAIIEEEI